MSSFRGGGGGGGGGGDSEELADFLEPLRAGVGGPDDPEEYRLTESRLIGGGGGVSEEGGLLLLLSTGGGGIPEGELGTGTCEGERMGGRGAPTLDFRFGEWCGTGGGGCEAIPGGGGGGALEGGGGDMTAGGSTAKESGREDENGREFLTSLPGLIIGTRAMSSAKILPPDGAGPLLAVPAPLFDFVMELRLTGGGGGAPPFLGFPIPPAEPRIGGGGGGGGGPPPPPIVT